MPAGGFGVRTLGLEPKRISKSRKDLQLLRECSFSPSTSDVSSVSTRLTLQLGMAWTCVRAFVAKSAPSALERAASHAVLSSPELRFASEPVYQLLGNNIKMRFTCYDLRYHDFSEATCRIEELLQ